MKANPRSRQASILSDSQCQRLNAYALAATAAGVGALALGQPADAKIIYTPANKNITPNHTIPLDLNHDGVNDFLFKDIHYATAPYGFSHIGKLSLVPVRRANEAVGTPDSTETMLPRSMRACPLGLMLSWRPAQESWPPSSATREPIL